MIQDYQWHKTAAGHYTATVHTVHGASPGSDIFSGAHSLIHLDLSPLAHLPIAWIIFCLFCMAVAWLVTR
jgi:hypothetical protein